MRRRRVVTWFHRRQLEQMEHQSPVDKLKQFEKKRNVTYGPWKRSPYEQREEVQVV
jgi:hypothetical protein